MIANGDIDVPDLLCGGTPCQAFSLAGWWAGINDDRGQLTLKFFDILNSMDSIRLARGHGRAVCLWENVEGGLLTATMLSAVFSQVWLVLTPRWNRRLARGESV